MDNYQKVEQLVNKAGCSYEDAKTALEGCGWDMLDAVISLERDGKVKKETAEQTAQKAEETIEIIPEVKAEERSGSTGGSGSGGSSSGSTGNNSGSESADSSRRDAGSNGKAGKAPKEKHRFFNRVKRMMVNNRMVILKGNGQQIIDLPIIVPVIALLMFFWATLILAVIAMVFGFRFHFEGEDLGKTNINNTMDKATNYAEKVRSDLTKKSYDEQNTDH